MSLHKKFGCIIFDDPKEPEAGWAAIEGEDPERVDTLGDLSTNVVWWSNLNYDDFFNRSTVWKLPHLRHDKYLVTSPKDVLKEWGHKPEEVSSDFVARFCSIFFSRILNLSYKLVNETDPSLEFEDVFVNKTLREDLRILVPEAEYPKDEALEILQASKSYSEFTTTLMNPSKGNQIMTLRKPRVPYAVEMLKTPIPQGPWIHKSRSDLKGVSADRIKWMQEEERPCLSEVSIHKTDDTIGPIFGFGLAIDKDKRNARHWVAHPEFILLSKFSDLDIRSSYVGKEYTDIPSSLPEPVRAFLSDKFTEYSWSAGVVAETIWRACALAEEKEVLKFKKDKRAMMSWRGVWMKSADKASLFLTSMQLVEMGYTVNSYGIGWIRVALMKEDIPNMINDALSLGLLPSLSETSEFPVSKNANIPWGGDKKSLHLAKFTAQANKKFLWNLDTLPLLPKDKKQKMIKQMMR